MNIVEYINTERKEQGVSFSKFTEALGFSMQRFYQYMNQDDIRFGMARKMLCVLGKDFNIVQLADGTEAGINVGEMLENLEESEIMYNKAEAIISETGYKIVIVDAPEVTHDEAPEGEKK